MESICERDRFAKILEPDAHVSMRGQKGRRRHVCQTRGRRCREIRRHCTQFSRSALFVFAFSGTCRKEYIVYGAGPDGASWNFRRETTFRAQGTVYAIMTITRATGKLYVVIRSTNGFYFPITSNGGLH